MIPRRSLLNLSSKFTASVQIQPQNFGHRGLQTSSPFLAKEKKIDRKIKKKRIDPYKSYPDPPESKEKMNATWFLERTDEYPRLPEDILKRTTPQRVNRFAHKVYDEDKYNTYRKVKWAKHNANNDPIKLIMIRDSNDYGKKGQLLSVEDSNEAKLNLINPGLAVYATPENLEFYREILKDEYERSSRFLKNYVPVLARIVVAVSVHMENEWTMEPWMIKAAFRRQGWHVKEECISLPQTFTGPNLDWEGKEFLFYLTINKKEKFPMRGKVHYISNNPGDEIKTLGWMHRFCEPILEEQREALRRIPRNPIGIHTRKAPDATKDLDAYAEWLKEFNAVYYGISQQS